MKHKLFFIAVILLIANALTIFGQETRRTKETFIFPVNGKVEMEIVERIMKPSTVNFRKGKTKIATFTLLNGDSYKPHEFAALDSPFVKFRQLEKIEGLPVPLIQVLAIQPGGSDHSFWTILFGEVNGKIKMLTPKTLENSIQGGVHFGNLGRGNGIGLASFNFIWGKNEAHYENHHYRIDLYKFNKTAGMFVKTKSFISKKRHENEFRALKELGFTNFQNRLNDFPDIGDYRETEDGIGKN